MRLMQMQVVGLVARRGGRGEVYSTSSQGGIWEFA